MNLARSALAASVLTVVLGASACGTQDDDAGSGPGTDPDLTATGDGAEVALSIRTVSAWPNLHVDAAPAMPELVVDGDGRFYATVYEDDESSLRTGVLDPEDLDDLLEEAAALPRAGYGEPGLDGSVTTILLGAGSGSAERREVSVWVPTEVDSYDGAAREHRIAFNDVLERADILAEAGDVWDPKQWFLVGEETSHHPDDPTPAPWPVPGVDPRVGETNGLPCRVIGEDDADLVRAAQLDESPDVHGWTLAGEVYDVVLVPVLPGVECADLRRYFYPAG